MEIQDTNDYLIDEDNLRFDIVLKDATERGYPGAQVYVGLMYELGVEVDQDKETAMEWYRKAAEQGNAVAQFNLGLMYENGEGTLQDKETAVEWYRKAAEQGHADAQNNLIRINFSS